MSKALSRTNDPSTSAEAAEAVSVTRLEGTILFVLGEVPRDGYTLDELVERTGIDKVSLSPRLRPLCKKGLVVESPIKRRGNSGRYQTVWIIKN